MPHARVFSPPTWWHLWEASLNAMTSPQSKVKQVEKYEIIPPRLIQKQQRIVPILGLGKILTSSWDVHIMTVDVGRKKPKHQPSNLSSRTRFNIPRLVTSFSAGFEPSLSLITILWWRIANRYLCTSTRALILSSELQSFLVTFEESISMGYRNRNSPLWWSLQSSCHERHDAPPRHSIIHQNGQGMLSWQNSTKLNRPTEITTEPQHRRFVSFKQGGLCTRLVWLSTTRLCAN